MLPDMAASMSESVGCGLLASTAEADMIWPDWWRRRQSGAPPAPNFRIQAGSGNVRGIDIILVLLWLMTFEALFGGIRDQWFCWITSRPGLKAPASRRGILLLVLQHDGGRLPWTFHVGAIGDGEFVQIDQQHGLVRIWFAFLERGRSGRIDINVMHSAHRLKEGAAFVDDHRIDGVPVTEARWELEIVGRLRGGGGNGAHNSRGQQAQPSAPLDPRPPSAISDPDAAHGASP